jgi:hypothetical protein
MREIGEKLDWNLEYGHAVADVICVLAATVLFDRLVPPVVRRDASPVRKPFFAKTTLQQRPESAGRCALGIPRKADTPQWQASRAETVQPRP